MSHLSGYGCIKIFIQGTEGLKENCLYKPVEGRREKERLTKQGNLIFDGRSCLPSRLGIRSIIYFVEYWPCSRWMRDLIACWKFSGAFSSHPCCEKCGSSQVMSSPPDWNIISLVQQPLPLRWLDHNEVCYFSSLCSLNPLPKRRISFLYFW